MGIKIVIGEVRFSYAHVWEPWSNNGKEAKYSVSLLIPKSNEKMLNQIRLAIKQAKQQGVSKWGSGTVTKIVQMMQSMQGIIL